MRFDEVAVEAGHDDRLARIEPRREAQSMLDERAARDLDERLRPVRGERAQAQAHAGREDDHTVGAGRGHRAIRSFPARTSPAAGAFYADAGIRYHSPMPSAATTARTLAEALPYLRAYHGKIIVVRFGGRAMADAELKATFARDVALLRLVGMKPVVVHGGGWRIDELLATMGIPTRRRHGLRVTDEKTLTVVEMALDELNQELAGLINQHGGRAVGLNGQDGRFIRAVPMRVAPAPGEEPVDLGYVGDVERIDVELVELLLSRGFVPVVLPLGVADDGTAYHIDSDRLAGALARSLAAEKLILMTNAEGIADARGNLAYILTASELERLVADGKVPDENAPRAKAALDAVREGVRSVHIVNGGVPSALLLEVLTAEGVGTAVRSDEGPHFLEDSRAYLLER